MDGLMQNVPLTVDRIIDHAAAWHGAREIVSRDAEGRVSRSTYAGVHADAKRVSNALAAEGIKPGDRVATMAWNGARHLAAWYGAAGMGAVLHTLNPRLFLEQIAYIANHAGDRLLLADPATAELVEQLLPQVPSIEKVIFFCGAASLPQTSVAAIAFDDWIAGQPAEHAWGGFDENAACGLCYTSGTTGNPKGVLYSHRSNYIHALMTLQRDALALSARDTVLLVVPMYHANAWGVVYSAPAVGAKLVLPGQRMDGESIYNLIEEEGVTYSAAVPTVWQMLLQYMQENGKRFTTLERVTIGGSACPESIIRTFRDDYGVDVIQGWGMTETSPLGTVSVPNASVAAKSDAEQMAYKLKQGRLLCGLEMKLVDDAGNRLPHDGRTPGRLMVKGPTIAAAYFGGEGGDVLDAEGFFDTGDVSTIDGEGICRSPIAPRMSSNRAASGSVRSRSRISRWGMTPSPTRRSSALHIRNGTNDRSCCASSNPARAPRPTIFAPIWTAGSPNGGCPTMCCSSAKSRWVRPARSTRKRSAPGWRGISCPLKSPADQDHK